MAGRHDRAAAEFWSSLLLAGPIVVRGLSRSVRNAMGAGQEARHRLQPAAAALELFEEGGPDLEQPVSPPEDGKEADVSEQRPASESYPETASGSIEPGASETRDPADDVRSDRTEGDHPSGGSTGTSSRSASASADGWTPAPQGSGTNAEGGSERRRGLPRSGERLERVALALLVVLAVVCAGLTGAVVLKARADAAAAAREVAAYTPPSRARASSSAQGPSLAILGDESASRSASGVDAAGQWPLLLADAVEGEVYLRAETGAGYTASSGDGTNFVDAARRIPVGTDLVLFVGGAADAGASSLSLARAATEAFSEASQRASGAVVIAVGPLFRPKSLSEEAFSDLRTTLRNAARIAGVRWVDPVSSRWLSSERGEGALTSSDERVVTKRLQTLIAGAL